MFKDKTIHFFQIKNSQKRGNPLFKITSFITSQFEPSVHVSGGKKISLISDFHIHGHAYAHGKQTL